MLEPHQRHHPKGSFGGYPAPAPAVKARKTCCSCFVGSVESSLVVPRCDAGSLRKPLKTHFWDNHDEACTVASRRPLSTGCVFLFISHHACSSNHRVILTPFFSKCACVCPCVCAYVRMVWYVCRCFCLFPHVTARLDASRGREQAAQR